MPSLHISVEAIVTLDSKIFCYSGIAVRLATRQGAKFALSSGYVYMYVKVYCKFYSQSNFTFIVDIDEIASIMGVSDDRNGISGSGVQSFASQLGSPDGMY